MYKYKKYSKLVVSVLIFLFLLHFFSWNTYTKFVFPKEYGIGDLGRTSYQLNTLLPRLNISELEGKSITLEEWSNLNVDLLTVGDSFSNGGGGGKNSYYQSYLSLENDFTVFNLNKFTSSSNIIESIISLVNSGLLDNWNTKYLVLESVERLAVNRFSQKVNVNVSSNTNVFKFDDSSFYIPSNYIELKDEFLVHDKQSSFLDFNKYDINIINNLNLNALKYNILYHFDPRAYTSSVYKLYLDQDLFTSKDKRSLLFFKDDIKSLPLSNFNNIKKLNDNLNKLSELLSSKGITLYFMPVVDKYNLYSKYIVNNPYPKSTFFEELRKLPKNYEFIDTKAILTQELEKGVKDLYYPDDTHWSYKASEAIFKKVKFE